MPPPLLTDQLRKVSRSFYLTMRVLPRSVRPSISLAYLLARTSDTIADTEVLPHQRRLEALHQLEQRIVGQTSNPLDYTEFIGHQGVPAEQELLGRVEESLAALVNLPDYDREQICEVLRIIISGQELDLRRFPSQDPNCVIALQTEEELDDYTFRVAGCVGVFGTRLCLAHLWADCPDVEPGYLLDRGVRFGKGLQLTNVLRDLPRDLRQGRCYLPWEALRALGLEPQQLLDPNREAQLRPLYNRYLDLATEHLQAGWDYTNHIPWSNLRLRLACAWPILIGLRTLTRLRGGCVLDPSIRLKVSRGEIRKLILRSVALYPFPKAWRRLFHENRTHLPHA